MTIQKFFTSRDNEANSASYVGQLDRLWYDPVTNTIRVSDGETEGGVLVSGGGGGGTPGGANSTVQFNDNGVLAGSGNLTWDGESLSANAVRTDNLLQSDGTPWDFDGNILITSNITSITAGQRLLVSGPDLSDPTYPQGIWTIYQAPQPTFGLTSAVWVSTMSGTKNAYANFVAGTVNTSNITLTFSTSGTFDVQAGDYVVIGSANIDATTLGISGSVSTVTIPSGNFSAASQTATSVGISTALTVSGQGQQGPSAATIYNTQPTAYSISGLSGGWLTARVPYWDGTNNYYWSYNATGTVNSGNISAANAVSSRANVYVGTGRSGSVTGANSLAAGTTTIWANTVGTGFNGYGTTTSNAAVSFGAAPAYYPFFTQIASGQTVPTFTTATAHGTANSAIGDVFTSGSVATDTAWIAVPTRFTLPSSFQIYLTGFGWSDPFAAPLGNTDITIAGETYRVYGIDGGTATTDIRTSSLAPT